MGNRNGNGASLLSGAEEGAVRGALGLDDVVRVVSEGLAGLQIGELANNAVTLHDQGVTLGIFYDPLAAEDVDGLGGVIVDGDLINEGVRALRGSRAGLVVFHAVDRDGESFERFKLSCHNGSC